MLGWPERPWLRQRRPAQWRQLRSRHWRQNLRPRGCRLPSSPSCRCSRGRKSQCPCSEESHCGSQGSRRRRGLRALCLPCPPAAADARRERRTGQRVAEPRRPRPRQRRPQRRRQRRTRRRRGRPWDWRPPRSCWRPQSRWSHPPPVAGQPPPRRRPRRATPARQSGWPSPGSRWRRLQRPRPGQQWSTAQTRDKWTDDGDEDTPEVVRASCCRGQGRARARGIARGRAGQQPIRRSSKRA